MATTTPNLGLTKPATSDNVDITVINRNMDIIDSAVGGGISSVSATDDTNTITVPRDGTYLVSLVGQKQSAAVGAHKILLNNAFLIGAVTNDKEQFVNISFPLVCHRNDVISFSTTVPFISNYADYMSYLMIAYITPAS